MCTLTIYFEDPFWVGVFERIEEGRLSVCRVTFGAEPQDYELWDFVLRRYNALRFSPAVEAPVKALSDTPKRRARDVSRQLQARGVGTRSQQALAAQREELKQARRQVARQRREEEAQRLFDLKRQRRREKHRGH